MEIIGRTKHTKRNKCIVILQKSNRFSTKYPTTTVIYKKKQKQKQSAFLLTGFHGHQNIKYLLFHLLPDFNYYEIAVCSSESSQINITELTPFSSQ
jgi:hypothetical protein